MNSMELKGNKISVDSLARVAGFSYLFGIAIVMFGYFYVSASLIVQGNASETARNIMAHETLFRINIACDLLYIINVIILFTALYLILKPVNRGLALATVFFRLVYALTWVVVAFNMLNALTILSDHSYLHVFETDRLQALARLELRGGFNVYYIGLPFWALASTICNYLFLMSRFIPRVLAVFGIITSVWCVFCAFAFIAFPNFDKVVDISLFDFPMVIIETITGFWLLLKGIKILEQSSV